jgi:hypothetical protein
MNENQEIHVRSRRSRDEIQRLVLEFEASGLRQKEFCRNHGLALSALQRPSKIALYFSLEKTDTRTLRPSSNPKLVSCEFV